jgi:hypothetical protein
MLREDRREHAWDNVNDWRRAATRTHLGGVPGSPAPGPGLGEAASPNVPPPICSGVRSTGHNREPRLAPSWSTPPSLLAAAAEAARGGRNLVPHTLPSWRSPERIRRYRAFASMPASVPSQLDWPPLRALVLPATNPLITHAWQHCAKQLSVVENQHAASDRPRPIRSAECRLPVEYRSR